MSIMELFTFSFDNVKYRSTTYYYFHSICYILDETDPEGDIHPLFEIQLCLEVSTNLLSVSLQLIIILYPNRIPKLVSDHR